MPAVVPVGASVTLKSSEKTVTTGVAGEALAAGSMVYRKVADGKWWLAVNTIDMSDATVVSGMGVALSPSDSADDAAIVAAESGSEIDLGTTMDKDTHYPISGSGGTLEEYADMTAGEYINWWGYGNGSNLILDPQATGLTK
jgi:hypothetical protein